MNAMLPQQRINISDTHDLERFIVSNLKGNILNFPNKEGALNLDAHCYSVSDTDLWFCSYGTPITLEFPEADYFRVQLHVRGVGNTKIGRQLLGVTPDQAIISTTNAQIHFGEDFQQKVLRINKDKLTQKISALTGMPLIRALEFEAVFNSRSPRFKLFRHTLDFIENLIHSTRQPIPSLILAELEQSLLTAMLCSIPNNYSFLLENQSLRAAPREVRLIEAYIEANWDQPILIEDLVAISGASARSIFRAFKQYRGHSPLAFAKQVRLRQAHTMLLNAEESTVTHIAFCCGFSDLGRFSRDYAKAFGELPSQTRKKSLRHNPKQLAVIA